MRQAQFFRPSRTADRSSGIAIVPALALLGLFFLIPAIWSIGISLTPITLLGPDAGSTEYIGLANYRRLFDDPDFGKYVRNTIVYVGGVAIAGSTGLGLVLAIIIDRAQKTGQKLAGVAFGAVVLAGIAPPALTGAIWGGMLDYRKGMLNEVLVAFGADRVDLLGQHPMFSVILAESWRGAAFAMVIFYGALQTIPALLYEADRLDGGTVWSRFWGITFPELRQMIALVSLITTIMAAGSFITNQILTSGGTGRQSETLALYAFHIAFTDFRIGFGAAISVVILAICGVFAAGFLWLARTGH